MLLSDVCLTSLSVAYIGNNSRTERLRKTKSGPRHTWLGHHFQGQRSKVNLLVYLRIKAQRKHWTRTTSTNFTRWTLFETGN